MDVSTQLILQADDWVSTSTKDPKFGINTLFSGIPNFDLFSGFFRALITWGDLVSGILGLMALVQVCGWVISICLRCAHPPFHPNASMPLRWLTTLFPSAIEALRRLPSFRPDLKPSAPAPASSSSPNGSSPPAGSTFRRFHAAFPVPSLASLKGNRSKRSSPPPSPASLSLGPVPSAMEELPASHQHLFASVADPNPVTAVSSPKVVTFARSPMIFSPSSGQPTPNAWSTVPTYQALLQELRNLQRELECSPPPATPEALHSKQVLLFDIASNIEKLETRRDELDLAQLTAEIRKLKLQRQQLDLVSS